MKFCENCGAQLEDNMQFCNQCGSPQAPQQETPVVNVNVSSQMPRFSDWDGSVFDTFVNSLAASLIMTLTCGIATPWAVCYMMKFIIGHATIDGKRLVFDGTGGSLFGQWLKWFLLTAITCGIYSFWVAPRLYKWVASHIHFAN